MLGNGLARAERHFAEIPGNYPGSSGIVSDGRLRPAVSTIRRAWAIRRFVSGAQRRVTAIRRRRRSDGVVLNRAQAMP
ncbi:hypothetical protein GCM10010411_61840 [Actinomadura fulvescens]|uniref:Transposase n=1 Tax=Actinomadura fulvescens TaxID=46160 RepID=A0ABP6CIA8_9ACTN